jgi:methylene-fatty-acyl-phospholipid synthase
VSILHAVIQFAAVLLWFSSIQPRGLCIHLNQVSLLQWLAFLILVCYGQSLNVGIFQAIGHDGVYYGFKLGRKIPWVTGWPFDTVSHPQYVGSVLTIWGFVALVWGQYPGTPLLLTAGYWTLVYAATAVHEQYL